jgi:hypothetical protein
MLGEAALPQTGRLVSFLEKKSQYSLSAFKALMMLLGCRVLSDSII